MCDLDFEGKEATFEDAKKFCSNKSKHLLALDTEKKWKQVFSRNKPDNGSDRYYWTEFEHCNGTEAKLKISGGECKKLDFYSNPNNSKFKEGKNQKYALLLQLSKTGNLAFDLTKVEKQKKFICARSCSTAFVVKTSTAIANTTTISNLPPESSSSKDFLRVGVPSLLAVLIATIVGLVFFWRRRKRNKRQRKNSSDPAGETRSSALYGSSPAAPTAGNSDLDEHAYATIGEVHHEDRSLEVVSPLYGEAGGDQAGPRRLDEENRGGMINSVLYSSLPTE